MKKTLTFYLAGYNFVAFWFWLLYLVVFISSGFVLTDLGLIFLNIAQGIAVLEIFHVLLKLVKSPILSTVSQVVSRIFILILINLFIHHEPLRAITTTGIIMVSIAWSITEIVRYSFYFFGLFRIKTGWLTWMRYSFFIVLYIVGVIGEWLIIATPIFENGISINGYLILLIASAIGYIYFFPKLYRYMWKQRAAKITN